MRIVHTQAQLERLIDDFADAPYWAVDTEFVRERTYWPQLCLIQIARPAGVDGRHDPAADGPEHSALIDPIEGDLDLGPLFDAFARPDLVKVFHAARQDVEIFAHLSGAPPAPLYDTQVAAMACGFGDQVGYETLVRKISHAKLDKSSRVSDWSRRPLTQRQLSYAISDVTHLRGIYENLRDQIAECGRGHWVAEEMAVLGDPGTYAVDPEAQWRRLKLRSGSGKFLSIARELAAWRERTAQSRDVPRNRIMRDDALLELCAMEPSEPEDLGRARLYRESRKSDDAAAIVAAVTRGKETPKERQPTLPEPRQLKNGAAGVVELLKVLLKANSDRIGVAQRLIATSADLEEIALSETPDTPTMRGWRFEAFGEDALRLKRGEIALSAGARGVEVVRREPAAQTPPIEVDA